MAKALQCPSCGRKHPVTTLPHTATFPCSGCGQSLKVPAQFRQPTGSDRVQPSAPVAGVASAPAGRARRCGIAAPSGPHPRDARRHATAAGGAAHGAAPAADPSRARPGAGRSRR